MEVKKVMTHLCRSYGCQEKAHSGSNLCYKHLPAIPLQEAKEKLALMKEELSAIRNYSDILKREVKKLEEETRNASAKAFNAYVLANRKELEVKFSFITV